MRPLRGFIRRPPGAHIACAFCLVFAGGMLHVVLWPDVLRAPLALTRRWCDMAPARQAGSHALDARTRGMIACRLPASSADENPMRTVSQATLWTQFARWMRHTLQRADSCARERSDGILPRAAGRRGERVEAWTMGATGTGELGDRRAARAMPARIRARRGPRGRRTGTARAVGC